MEVNFRSGAYQVNENQGFITVEVERTSPIGELHVDFATEGVHDSNGSA